MKHISALITALLITTVIGIGILVIGMNALTNKNTVTIQDSPNNSNSANIQTSGSSNSFGSSVTTSVEVQQLQQQVSDLQSQVYLENQAIQQ
jgi:hypothetical protein